MPGTFITRVYLANDFQSKYAIKLQPETQTLEFDGRSNPDSGTDVEGRPRIVVKGSRRSYQPIARTVSFKFAGAVPDGYKPNSVIRLPWLYPTGFDQLLAGKMGTYRGFPVVVISSLNESLPRA